jgi:transglutaminase-like putative cysteine protease
MARYAEGVQTPTEPMQLKGGTCRGFALLMIDAVRVLGLAARL